LVIARRFVILRVARALDPEEKVVFSGLKRKKKTADLTKLADAAFRVAARKVLERAEATGTPVINWEDGGIRAVPPSRLRHKLNARPKRSSKR
jgi:hypothetical protein